MLSRFLLLIFLFLSFSGCRLIKELEEARKEKEEEYKKLNLYAQSVHTKAKVIKNYIQEMKEEGKEVIKVRPGLNEVRAEYTKCLSYIYKQALKFKVMEENKPYYIRNCLKEYEKKLEAIATYYERGFLTSGLREVLTKEQQARRDKKQETHRNYKIRQTDAKLAFEMIMSKEYERELSYKSEAKFKCGFKVGGQGKFAYDSCVEIKLIEIREYWKNQINKVNKAMDRKNLNICLRQEEKKKSEYKICLKKHWKSRGKINEYCESPHPEFCIKRFTIEAVRKAYQVDFFPILPSLNPP